ncbi:MAG: hypothetical protein GY716_15260 [bacterium]|nr:hypothetical protein [bacterium]
MRTRVAASLLFLAVVLGWVVPVDAEVSATRRSGRAHTLLMDRLSITDGADPVPTLGWAAYSNAAAVGTLLNPSGEARDDGRPDVVWHPTTGSPVVVWAYNNGTDHDIAFSAWTGTQWSAIVFLTASTDDEIDPRAFIEHDGTVHVVWWVDSDEPKVMMTRRNPTTGHWLAPLRVSAVDEQARKPTVAVLGQVPRVAYELEPGTNFQAGREIVVRRWEGDVFASEQTVPAGINAEGLEPLLRVLGDTIWLEWFESATELGYARRAAGSADWGSPATVTLFGDSWIDVEDARKRVALQIWLTPPDVTDPGPTTPD